MIRALYGHPQSGGWWELHADRKAQDKGYVPIPNWRGCYWHPTKSIFLIIYVDDFKMAGPDKELEAAWKELRSEIDMDDPTPFGLFLGCKHTIHELHPKGAPRPVKMMEYDVQGYLAKALQDYADATNTTVEKISPKPTPFLTGLNLGRDLNAPITQGEWLSCPWCLGHFDARCFGHGHGNTVKKKGEPLLSPSLMAEADDKGQEGIMGELAMSVLMKILYAARYARHDLLGAVAKLAQCIHKWTPSCDKGLHRLMAYVKYSLPYRQVGWVGDSLSDLKVHLYSDADFAGCAETKRSTTGIHTVVLGPWTCFPINGQSKRQ